MITQKRMRASTANRSSLLKTVIGIMAILLLVVIISSSYTYYTTKSEKNIIYEEWVVKAGDSIWHIAGIFTPVNEDKRKLVHEIQEINGIENSHIEPGDILLIPVEVSE